MRHFGLTFLLLGALSLITPIYGQDAGPILWRSGLKPGDPPAKVESGKPAPPCAEDAVLWQAGRPILLVKAGQVPPKSLPEGQTVTLLVRDADGKPAAGILLEWKPEDLPNLPEPFGRVRTDARGVTRIPVEAGKATVVWVEDEGYLPMVTTLAPSTLQASLLLVPERGRVLLVKDAYGRDIASAQLKAFPLKAMSDPFNLMKNMGTLQRTAAGDEVGRIALSEDFQHAAGGVVAPECSLLEVPSFDGLRTVILKGAQPLSVTVRDKATKAPIKGAKVRGSCCSANIPVLVFGVEEEWAEGSGTVAPGAYPFKLEASAKGRVPEEVKLGERPSDGKLEVLLEKGVVLAGTVVDTKGQGIPEAYVTTGRSLDSISADTAKDGTFELPPLPATDGPVTLTAGAEGYLDREVASLPPKDNASLRIVLDRGAEVSGRVVDEETRQPVVGARVTVDVEASSSSRGVNFEAKVAPDGTFAESGLDPGTYMVRAYAKEGASPAVKVTVAGTEPHDLGDLLLSGHPMVKGRLVAPDGETLSAGATVHLERLVNFKEVTAELSSRTLEGTVGDDGAFVIRAAAAGRYRLVASDGERKRVVSPVAVDKDDVDVGKVLLEKPCAIRGRIVRKDGQSASSWRVTLATQAFDFDPPTAFAEEDGAFRFDDLAAGVYRLQVFSPLKLMPEADQRIELAAGQELEVTVPVGGVTVTAFVQVDGRPAGGASVSLAGRSDSVFESGVVSVQSEWGRVILGLPSIPHGGAADGSGQVTIEGVSPGPNQASLKLNDMSYSMPVAVPMEFQAPLTWNFKGMELTGKVLNPDGSPAPNMIVAVGYQGVGSTPGNSVATDAAGAFHMTGLGEGTIILGCRDEGGLTATATVTLKEGQAPPPVTMNLKAGP